MATSQSRTAEYLQRLREDPARWAEHLARKRAANRKYHASRTPEQRAARREWQKNYRADKAAVHKSYRLKAKYGITPEEAHTLWAASGGACPICREPISDPALGVGGCHVDHDHSTGDVRGVLCPRCNKGLGHFLDNSGLLRSAAAYLEAACSYSKQ